MVSVKQVNVYGAVARNREYPFFIPFVEDHTVGFSLDFHKKFQSIFFRYKIFYTNNTRETRANTVSRPLPMTVVHPMRERFVVPSAGWRRFNVAEHGFRVQVSVTFVRAEEREREEVCFFNRMLIVSDCHIMQVLFRCDAFCMLLLFHLTFSEDYAQSYFTIYTEYFKFILVVIRWWWEISKLQRHFDKFRYLCWKC